MLSARWLQILIEPEGPMPDGLDDVLMELGALSVELRDAGDEPILEPAPGTAPLWPHVRVSALFEDSTDPAQLTAGLLKAMPALNRAAISFETLQDRDWVRQWQQDAVPLFFGKRLAVYPSHCARPDVEIAVKLDPGLAFGTGTHPTTALCLEWLAEQSLSGAAALDFGCGSGLLAIAAVRLGARTADAVDIDPQALSATRDNARRNGCESQIRTLDAGELETDRTFDVIVANILSGTLITLSPTLLRHAKAGTRIALSGILREQADTVRLAYAGAVDFDKPRCSGDWALLAGTVIH